MMFEHLKGNLTHIDFFIDHATVFIKYCVLTGFGQFYFMGTRDHDLDFWRLSIYLPEQKNYKKYKTDNANDPEN